jgi:dihydrolipoamide dehydrogenase
MDSTAALGLPDVPARLLVIGGGYLGLELACVYAALGSAVTMVEALPGLLPAMDRDLVRPLQAALGRKFKGIHLNTKVEALEPLKDGINASFTGLESQVFDRVLVAVGRKPSTAGLGLENTKVRLDDKGFILHGADMQTDEPGVYVIGDAAGEPMLAHKAHADARIAVEAIAGRVLAAPKAMPAVVFTDPELAWVGLTEHDAKAQGFEVEAARYPWAANGKAHAIGATEGLSKVVVDKATGRILGAGACGQEAGALVSELALAIGMGATTADLSRTVHPHPTLNETMLGAAEVLLGCATDLYRPRRSGR